MWKDNRTKIRRFLRDPDANIWTDTLLLRNWNDAQFDFSEVIGLQAKVEALRVPGQYEVSYMYDWEWNFLPGDKAYQAFYFHHQSEYTVCNNWEMQIWVGTGSETDTGYAFTHPWECSTVTNTNRLAPVWFPYDFDQTKFIAWDKDPLLYMSKKEIQSRDSSWKIQAGSPYAYFREDALSNEFYLYPKPDAPVWDDIDGDTHAGQVMYTNEDGFLYVLEEDGTYALEEGGDYIFEEADKDAGTVVDITGQLLNKDQGIALDVIDTDNNVLLIYESQPVDIAAHDDEPDYPRFLQKYIEYAVLETAFSANTDGKIGSLQEYWAWRKELGHELLKRFTWKRLADRDFRLVSGGGGQGSRRGPRLPDTYPDVR